MRLSSSVARPEAATGVVPSEDGEPATATSRRRVHLLAALLAALSFMFVQLALAQNGSAATGDPCPATGMETVASDAEDYPPGSTAHFSGTGYTADCDVQLNISRPDSVVDTATVTTDLFGNFTYDYPLPPPPGVIGPYHLDVLGYAGATLASMDFTDANNDAHVAPGWAATNTTVTFSTLYREDDRRHRPARPDHAAGRLHEHQRRRDGLLVRYVERAGRSTRRPGRSTSQLTAGTGLATNNVGWARIDVTATTPPANQSGNAAEWLMQTFTNTAGTAGEQNDNPPVLIGDTTNPSATITFVDGSGNAIANPVLQNGVAATVRVRITSVRERDQVHRRRRPDLLQQPDRRDGDRQRRRQRLRHPVLVTDGFIRLTGGSIATNGTLTVQFTTTPNCTSGTYLVSSDPSTNASNPPSGTNQSVSTTGGSLTVAAGRRRPLDHEDRLARPGRDRRRR